MRIDVKHGLDLRVGGRPRQNIEPGPIIRHTALLGDDYIGLKPSVTASVGDRVRAGEALFHDRRDSRIRYCAPAAGTVTAINRGKRRRLESIVIRIDRGSASTDVVEFERLTAKRIASMAADDVVARLLESGQWPALRSRPFDRVPLPDQRPQWMFITAIDTGPLAPDPVVVVRDFAHEFAAGLAALSRLPQRQTFLCTAADAEIETDEMAPGVTRAEFAGPHPAGLPGTHIHYLARVSADASAWHIGYQDVIAIGSLFLTGRPWLERVIALGGSGVRDPRLIRVPAGASVGEMLAGERLEDHRSTTGPVLSRRAADGNAQYLGRYHRQVALLPAESRSSKRGEHPWKRPGLPGQRATLLQRVSKIIREPRAGMIPVEAFDRVWPLKISPAPLLRALLVRDTENAEALGCLALAEEDLALCAYVCPSRQDYASALRATLTSIELEM